MINLPSKTWLKTFARGVLLTVMAVLIAIPQVALAQPAEGEEETNKDPKAPKVDYSANDINYYDPRGNNVCGGTQSGGDTLTRFLQALAKQENGGKVTGDSGTGARGKYQYIDSTWKSHAALYYPPASKYANANLAPEEYQDAVAYIEYSVKFKDFKGDLFKLAISHFYPAANSNPSLLDQYPPGNVVTPRMYAQQFIQKVNSGDGKEIPIKASQAPQFAELLAKAGGEGGGGASGGQVCSANGVVAGDIIKTGLGLAWPTKGHGKDKNDATPAYQTAMPKYNPAAAATSNDPWSDCGVFVATVITAAADPNYQKRGTSSQISYMQAHPEKYEFFTSGDYTGSTEKLMPGDILINHGHTMLFTGPYKGGDGKLYNVADASWHGHVPQAQNWYSDGFYVGRVKK
jgi:hypothetical protein